MIRGTTPTDPLATWFRVEGVRPYAFPRSVSSTNSWSVYVPAELTVSVALTLLLLKFGSDPLELTPAFNVTEEVAVLGTSPSTVNTSGLFTPRLAMSQEPPEQVRFPGGVMTKL